MKSLTPCQANRTRVAVRTVKRDTARPGMESLTYCQANETRVIVRIVERDTAGPGMESLTSCQTIHPRLKKTMKRKVHPYAMKSLTPCQANSIKALIRRPQLHLVLFTDLKWHPA